MKLDLETVSNITLGAVRVEKEEDGFHFYRFTHQQEDLYKDRSDDFYKKCFATSGIQLSFKTDSRSLFIKASVSKGSSRSYFAFDIFINGTMVDSLNNFDGVELPCDYTSVSLQMGQFEKKFSLGAGVKNVSVYLPWSAKTVIQQFALDDDSFIEPVKTKYKMLCFGDSITQGYDALFSSNKYTSRLAKFLNAEEHNKGIGGETFFPELAKAKEEFVPDYITVAYGTNDWNRCTQQQFTTNVKAFFENLTENYPNSKIFVITPIWRKDHEENRAFGEFKDVERILCSLVEEYENITIISGYDFVEHDAKFFADLQLHPNDEGFGQYFKSLVEKVEV